MTSATTWELRLEIRRGDAAPDSSRARSTGQPGAARKLRASEPRLLLPRYIDTSTHTDAEFRAWLTAIATLLPRRRQGEATGQFLEAPVAS